MRMHVSPYEQVVAATGVILERQGKICPPPPELGHATLAELLDEGVVRVNVDPKYPQALGISTIVERTSLWGNSFWEILLNDEFDCPFFTSDYPIALEAKNARLANWIVPLAPTLAIRIVPDVSLSRAKPDLSFKRFSYRRRMPPRSELVEINRLIVKCAEDVVFYRDDLEWIPDFVAKNRHYRVEVVTNRVPEGSGFVIVSTQKVLARPLTPISRAALRPAGSGGGARSGSSTRRCNSRR